MKKEEGKRLKLFMDREGLSQEDMATLLKKSQTTISRYINGEISIPLLVLKKLHLEHKLNYAFIFHGTGTMKYKELTKRNIMTDITDILAGLGAVIESQEAIRKDFTKLSRDFYEFKHQQRRTGDTFNQ